VRTTCVALLAASATVIAAVSAGASPGSTAAYDISLTGSQRSVVTRTGTTNTADCTLRHADRDVQTVSFASRRRAPLAISTRGLPTIRFDLAARVTGSFHRESEPVGDCAAAPRKSDESCGPARLRARLVLHPRPNLGLRLNGGFVRARDRTRCATTLTTPDAFIRPIASRLKRSPAGAARITIHARVVVRTGAPGGVAKTTTIDWKLAVVRAT
jgi:hypothetical protein